MSHKKPLKATDKRRQYKRSKLESTHDSNGAGPALADIYNDRRGGHNGHGKRAV